MNKSKIVPLVALSLLLQGCTTSTPAEGSTETPTLSESATAETTVESVAGSITTTTTEEITQSIQSELSISIDTDTDTDTETETESIVNEPVYEKSVAQVYSEFIYNELVQNGAIVLWTNPANEELGIDEYTHKLVPVQVGEEGSMAACDSAFAFADMNLDGIPELLLGCFTPFGGHAMYNVYAQNGEVFNEFGCNIDPVFYLDGENIYTSDFGGMYGTYSRITGEYAEVYFCASGDNFYSAQTYSSGQSSDMYKNLTQTELNSLYESTFGVDASLFDTPSDFPFVWDILTVPDPENYTEQDIYDCIAALFDQYEALLAD